MEQLIYNKSLSWYCCTCTRPASFISGSQHDSPTPCASSHRESRCAKPDIARTRKRFRSSATTKPVVHRTSSFFEPVNSHTDGSPEQFARRVALQVSRIPRCRGNCLSLFDMSQCNRHKNLQGQLSEVQRCSKLMKYTGLAARLCGL